MGLRIAAWGTAAYLAWVAIYLLVFNLPLVPGHAESIPLRPWLIDQVSDRVNVAILSITGTRDIVFSAWAVGVPLVAVTAMMWQERREETRAALLYAVPSMIFLVMFWPIQGLAWEMDLVFAAFPAVYALAWVCAHDAKRTVVAAVLLMSAHIAFWRIVSGIDFINSRL
jgi:dipeptide/tripeptide permease